MSYPVVALGCVADIVRQGVDPRTVAANTRYIGLENIGSDGHLSDAAIVEANGLASTKFAFSRQHVLFGKLRPYLRKVIRPDFDGICSTDIIPIAPSQRLDRDYLFHWLRTDDVVNRATSMASGANLPRVSPRHLVEFEIPLPPLDEQRRIAAILDQADALRRMRQKQIAKLDRLEGATFLELFGDPVVDADRWPQAWLGQVLSDIESGWSPVCQDRAAIDGEWGVLKLGAVTHGWYNDQENKALPVDISPKPIYEVRVGDVLFTRKNTHELVAACAIVRETRPSLMMSDLLFRLRISTDAGIDAEYLTALLSNPTKRKQVQSLASGTAGSMPNISKSRLRTVHIATPPKELQRRFAQSVGEIERLRGETIGAARILEALFASLQHRAFTGQLTAKAAERELAEAG